MIGIFFLAIDLPFSDMMRLQWSFKQMLQWWLSVSPTRVAVERRQRQWVVPGNNNNAFEACARALIPRQIHTAYLEGYGQLVEKTVKLPWPKQPKLIWTNNAFNSDAVFKARASEKQSTVQRWLLVSTGDSTEWDASHLMKIMKLQ